MGKRSRIILIGCIDGIDFNINEYEETAQFALQCGYFPVIPMKLFPAEQRNSIQEVDFIRTVGKELLSCDEVITLHDWEQAPVNSKLLNIAHMAAIPVTHFTRFLSREQQIRNQETS